MSATAIWSAIGPFVGAVVGYGATFITESRADARATRHAKQEREEARADATADELRRFELRSLVEARESLLHLARQAYLAKTHSLTDAKSELSAALFRATSARQMVFDKALRDQCGLAAGDVMRNVPADENIDLKRYNDVIEQLAAEIRGLYGSVTSDQDVTTSDGENP